ncbi:MAG: CPBP family intramembrane metalloprotease [Flavobacteriales bacterium]|nr:CPBP family intramembrane metalloprotease [Flavobacteriales bacterium]
MMNVPFVLRMQWDTVRRHPFIAGLVVITAVAVMAYGVQHDRTLKAASYVVAMGLGAFVVDLFAQWRAAGPWLLVREPKREVLIVLGCTALGYLTLFARFVLLDWDSMQGLQRLTFIPLFGFVFPFFVALIMLWLKYKPRELGFSIAASVWMALPILILTAGSAWLVAPQDFTIGPILAEEGWSGLLVLGFLSAGLPEEFSRMLLQTRLGAWLKSPAVGWFIATVLWAFMHAPKWIGEGTDLYEGVMSSVRIIPLGLLWGYMTHRSNSILPAVFVHGLNVWGLQNF